MEYLLATAAGILGLLAVWAYRAKHGNRGSIRRDSSVDQDFAAGKLKPDLHYYYLGSEDAPYVIIGVRSDIVLENAGDWRGLGPRGSDDLRDLLRSTYDRWRQQGYTLAGFKILDENGQHLGDWYSVWDINIINPVVLSKDRQHLEIYPPPFPRLEP